MDKLFKLIGVGVVGITLVLMIVIISFCDSGRSEEIHRLMQKVETSDSIAKELGTKADSLEALVKDLDTVPTVIPTRPVIRYVDRERVDTVVAALDDTLAQRAIVEALEYERALVDSLNVVIDSMEVEVQRLDYNYGVLFASYEATKAERDELRFQVDWQQQLIGALEKNQKGSLGKRLALDAVKIGAALYVGHSIIAKK